MNLSGETLVILSVFEIGWFITISIYILLQRRSAAATFAWIFALAALPVVGFGLYFFFGPRKFSKRKKRRIEATQITEASARATQQEAHFDPHEAQLVRMLSLAVGWAGLPRQAKVELFFSGKDKFDALEREIANAQHHIHLEYYIWEPDELGTRLRDRLAERAREGIQVRVLVDGFGSNKSHDRFWSSLRAAGGEVRRFNELSFAHWRPRMANFRTHRKIVVCDGCVAFTGGMNVTRVHSEEFVGEKAWRDTHLLLRGEAAQGLAKVFFEDWIYAGGNVDNFERYLPHAATNRPDKGEASESLVQIVSSGPDEDINAIHKLFAHALASATRYVELTTPYFVPDETICDLLQTAAIGGVDVKLLVPESGDQPLVAAAARSYYPELIEAGVRIFEIESPVLHAKTLVVDDLAIVGTANTDNRSFRLNFEVAAAIHDRKIASMLRDVFARDLQGAQPVSLLELQNLPVTRRLASSFARLFSPIL